MLVPVWWAVILAVAACSSSTSPGPGQNEQETSGFGSQQIESGSRLYDAYCSGCHGGQMIDPGGGYFDLRTLTESEADRFRNSVLNGKNNMPPFRGALTPQEVDDLFAYVIAGE